MVCLDTDFLVALLRQEPSAFAKAIELTAINEKLTVTPITCTELFQGAFKAGKEEKIRQVDELLSTIELLVFDGMAAKESGKILNYLEAHGEKIGDADSIIAGIASRHGEKILTRNMRHFKKIPWVETTTW